MTLFRWKRQWDVDLPAAVDELDDESVKWLREAYVAVRPSSSDIRTHPERLWETGGQVFEIVCVTLDGGMRWPVFPSCFWDLPQKIADLFGARPWIQMVPDPTTGGLRPA